MILKSKLFTLWTLIFLCSLVSAQEKNLNKGETESAKMPGLEEIFLHFDQFDFYRDLYRFNLQIPLDQDKNSIKMRTEFIVSQKIKRGSFSDEKSFYFLSPLYNKYKEDSKFNPITYVLGMAQLSAAAYLAYRHIRKYGFID